MGKKKETVKNENKTRQKKRTQDEREQTLAAIALFERENPARSLSGEILAIEVAKKFHLALGTAKKDIQEVHRRRRKAAEIDQAYELGKALEELAMVQEKALKSDNLNAYLGAVNKKCDILGLDKLSIFVGTKEDMELSVALKIQEFSDKLTPTDEIKTEKESKDNEIPNTGGGKE